MEEKKNIQKVSKNELEALLMEAGGGDEEIVSALITFITEIHSKKQAIDEASTLEELYDAIADGIYNPIVAAANATTREAASAVMSSLLGINEKNVMNDIGVISEVFPNKFKDEEIQPSAVVAKVDKKIRSGALDENNSIHVRAELHDIAKRRAEGSALIEMPEMIRIKAGFIKRFKSYLADAKDRAVRLRTMIKQCRSITDVEVWFSRYLLIYPLQAAKEGDLIPLQSVVHMSNQRMMNELKECARFCGYEDIDEKCFDLDNVYKSIYTFCNARTGYKSPRGYFGALISKKIAEVNAG